MVKQQFQCSGKFVPAGITTDHALRQNCDPYFAVLFDDERAPYTKLIPLDVMQKARQDFGATNFNGRKVMCTFEEEGDADIISSPLIALKLI